MYTIEITTKQPVTDQQQQVLQQSVQDADPAAACEIHDNSCKISGGSIEPAKLSYLLGLATGSHSASEIVRLLLLYENV